MKEAVFRKDSSGDWIYVITDEDGCDLSVRLGKEKPRVWYYDINQEIWSDYDDGEPEEKIIGHSLLTGSYSAEEIVSKTKEQLHKLATWHKVAVAGKVRDARWVFPRDPS